MASPSVTSAGSNLLPSSGSEEDLQMVVDQRKQKRMLSNRESARRSRMRKQKHLDELMAQMNQLRKDNNQIVATLNITTQHYLGMEAENSVLRTQMMELSTRLQSLNDIIHCMNGETNNFACDGLQTNDSFMNPWNLMYMNQPQPIMASADMFQYC